MKKTSRILHWLCFVFGMSGMGALVALDGVAQIEVAQNEVTQGAQHDHQAHSAPEPAEPAATSDAAHQSHAADTAPATSNTAMDHAVHTVAEPGTLRDPHAYSNGYTRTTGPYVLFEGQHAHMADELTFTGIWIDRLEHVRHEEFDATELEGRLWRGNSYDRFMINAEAELVGNSLERAEIDFLLSHAVSPFWNLRLGTTHDLAEDQKRSWATISLRGLAPYWFDLETNIHIGGSGRSVFELEAEYDLLFTQRLILQPRLDFKAYGKSDIAAGRGEGASTLKAGMRLRYEFSRQFAPYIGVERAGMFGETAKLLPQGKDDRETHWVAGFRFWY